MNLAIVLFSISIRQKTISIKSPGAIESMTAPILAVCFWITGQLRRQYYNSDLAFCEILLMFQMLIGGEKNFEHFLISKPKQIAVPGTTPALFVNRRDCM